MRKNVLLGVSLAFSLMAVGACSGGSDDAATDGTPSATSTATSTASASAEPTAPADPNAAPEPDLEGIPDVVAVVNGEEIGRDEFVSTYEGMFSQYAMQAQMSGQPVDQDLLKAQVADNMVGNTLLIQEADNRGFTATPDAVDAALAEMAEQNGLESADAVITALTEQGMTEEEIRSQLETQVKVEQLIADEAGDTTPTDEEVQAAYDEAVAQQEAAGAASGQTAEMPPLEEVRPQVEEQVRSQKEGAAVEALVTSLRESADVTINLE
ncbi:SurA N-terminal domain-containing protein [Georgenia faecalis]|uniref:peptidylprolyl isomerase n=1 Tax=Georgenia faecalis TaxID=2483799 RepID=A0ABV9DAW1_9MICO|nr:SurA N-terminal domain-containing protein [Georgenia faecalis]